MRNALILLGLALSGVSAPAAAGSGAGPGRCSDVSFEVSVTSQNVVFESPPDLNNVTETVDFVREAWRGNFPATNGTAPVSGTFTIKGTYCAPGGAKPARGQADTLEVLVHGITYNKSMWAGLGFGPPYDWHAHANARGYATLALDRLGHGDNPARPDPLGVVQPQMHVEILHAVLAAVRGGGSNANANANPLGRTFDRVVLVGHSYGSFLGAALAGLYPDDADALVLTAYNSYADFTAVIEADWVQAGAAAAAEEEEEKEKEKKEAVPPAGYLAMASEAQRTAAFYFGDRFDAAIPPVDFALQDTITPGEIGALGALVAAASPAADYAGSVLVATAVHDVFFCRPPAAACEALLAAAGDVFPSAAAYDYFAPDDTGHDLTLHYSAGDTARRVHDWLDENLVAKGGGRGCGRGKAGRI